MDLTQFTQALEAALNILLISGIFIAFFLRLENRFKRTKALNGLYRLRAIAHVIDMHQLTKDPGHVVGNSRTSSSPLRDLSDEQLLRYLDYCAEMLSLTGKLAALYAQYFPDATVVAAVNDVEQLATNLSRKIWQKIVLVQPGPRRGIVGHMNDELDPLSHAVALIRCPSVTPDEAGALDYAESQLAKAGFNCRRLRFVSDGLPEIDNLYARIGTSAPHLCFAGHVDVVPPGDEAAWTSPPFAAEVRDGVLYGRGAVDMKGGIAAMLAAVFRHLRDSGRQAARQHQLPAHRRRGRPR